MHREPILSSLAAGPTPSDADKAGTNPSDGDRSASARKAFSRPQKPMDWPDCEAKASLSNSVNMADQDTAGRQQPTTAAEAKAKAKPQAAGVCLMREFISTIKTMQATRRAYAHQCWCPL